MGKAQIIVNTCGRRELEAGQIKNFLWGNGYSLSEDTLIIDPNADVILLHACGCTKAEEDFGFELLRRIQEKKKPKSRIIFGGCIPGINPERVSREFGGPTYSPQSYSKLNDILDAKHKFEEFPQPNTISLYRRMSLFNEILYGLAYKGARLLSAISANFYPQKFYIQIQKGCSMRCSYCAIRKAIGSLRSKPIETILDELKAGLDNGFRRFQLIGDNAGSYGRDIGTNMGYLLDYISAIEGDFYLDLDNINPVYFPRVFESVKTLCTHNRVTGFYVPIQSANERVLKLMKRDCDMDTVKQMLMNVKNLASPKFKLGTSVIVGYPSETVQELNETITFCNEVGFDWIWCFGFSPRPGTPAAVSPDQIPDDEILRRCRLVKSQLEWKSVVTTSEDRAEQGYYNYESRCQPYDFSRVLLRKFHESLKKFL